MTDMRGEVPLFDALAPGHLVTVAEIPEAVHVNGETRLQIWHRWECSCGQVCQGRSSHHDGARQRGQTHADQATRANTRSLT